MRATRWLLGSCTALTVVASVAAGCGSSSNSASPQDSGTADVTMDTGTMMEAAAEAEPETGPEAASDAACVPDSSIQMFSVPDANIGDGGNTEACLKCFEMDCMTLVSACNASCACVSAYGTFANCISMGSPGLSTLIACGTAFSSNSGGIITSPTQLACAAGCVNLCGITLPADGGGDTGMKGDTGTGDSAAD